MKRPKTSGTINFSNTTAILLKRNRDAKRAKIFMYNKPDNCL
jgi:hypothetical protein